MTGYPAATPHGSSTSGYRRYDRRALRHFPYPRFGPINESPTSHSRGFCFCGLCFRIAPDIPLCQRKNFPRLPGNGMR